MWLVLCLLELCTFAAQSSAYRLTRIKKNLMEELNAFSTYSSTQPS